MEYGPAHKLALGGFAPNLERLKQPGMTIRRLRERATYDMKQLDREIPAPEWGLFLGRKLLDRARHVLAPLLADTSGASIE